MKEWTEVIRDTRFFNLLVCNPDTVNANLSFDIGGFRGSMTVNYETVKVVKNGFPGSPSFIAVSDAQCHATQDSTQDRVIPHASDPAPAQRAGNVAFIWTRGDDPSEPYREDGFPAVVLAVNLSKHYYYGALHRKRQHPAIKAEYMAALWYDKPGGVAYRGNGPSSVTFENYKEFWVDGEFKGHRWTEVLPFWNHRVLDTPEDEDTLGEFLCNLKGTTNLFTNAYFTNVEDEVCYMADFA